MSSITIGLGLFACQLLLTYPIISLTSTLWYGLRTSTVYIYQLAYPKEITNDPKYQVITKKNLSQLDAETRNKLIETYGEDVLIISAKPTD